MVSTWMHCGQHAPQQTSRVAFFREMQELEALEMQREEETGGAAQPPTSAAAQQQQGEEQRRAALQMSGEEAWKRRGMWTAGPDSGAGLGLGSGGGGLGFGGASGGMASFGGPKGGPKGMSLAQASLMFGCLMKPRACCQMAADCCAGTQPLVHSHCLLLCIYRCCVCLNAETAREDGLEGGRGPRP